MAARFVVLHYTVCGGWVNCWSDENGQPQTFATYADAQAATDEFLNDWNATHDGEARYSWDEFNIAEE